MSDDERIPWPAAEAFERGDNPERTRRHVENQRRDALVGILSEHDADHSEHFWRKVAGRLVAFSPRVCQLLEPPAPTLHRSLQQTPINRLTDEEFWAERVAEDRIQLAHDEAIWEKVKAHNAAEGEHDPDLRAAAEDDARISKDRADEKAADDGPDWLAS